VNPPLTAIRAIIKSVYMRECLGKPIKAESRCDATTTWSIPTRLPRSFGWCWHQTPPIYLCGL